MYLDDDIRVLRAQFGPLIYGHLYIHSRSSFIYVLTRVSLCYCHLSGMYPHYSRWTRSRRSRSRGDLARLVTFIIALWRHVLHGRHGGGQGRAETAAGLGNMILWMSIEGCCVHSSYPLFHSLLYLHLPSWIMARLKGLINSKNMTTWKTTHVYLSGHKLYITFAS